MEDWQSDFLNACCDRADGVAVGEGAFSPGPALWVGKREVAHFDSERTLDVRLTKAAIRDRRSELQSDDRVILRRRASDWLEIRVRSDKDVDWAANVILDAVAANRPTAKPGLPPMGAELEHRRRFQLVPPMGSLPTVANRSVAQPKCR